MPDDLWRPARHERRPREFVPESRFGFWFLGTHTWEKHVVEIALDELVGLISEPRASYPVLLDAGCSQVGTQPTHRDQRLRDIRLSSCGPTRFRSQSDLRD